MSRACLPFMLLLMFSSYVFVAWIVPVDLSSADNQIQRFLWLLL